MERAPANQVVRDWKAALDELLADVERWATELGWATARQRKRLREKALGEYQVEDLVVKTPSGVVILEVKGRDVVNADGRVDLYVLHNLNRMLLIRTGDRWVLKTDTGVRWPKPWGREAFAELPELVASAA